MLWNTPEREGLFEFYKIKIIIIPGLQPLTGEMYDLVDILIKDDRWSLVFVDNDAMVFLRGRENEEVIRKYAIPKIEAYNQVISQGNNLIRLGLNNHYVWQALARAYMGKGQIYESQMAYARALELRGK